MFQYFFPERQAQEIQENKVSLLSYSQRHSSLLLNISKQFYPTIQMNAPYCAVPDVRHYVVLQV